MIEQFTANFNSAVSENCGQRPLRHCMENPRDGFEHLYPKIVLLLGLVLSARTKRCLLKKDQVSRL